MLPPQQHKLLDFNNASNRRQLLAPCVLHSFKPESAAGPHLPCLACWIHAAHCSAHRDTLETTATLCKEMPFRTPHSPSQQRQQSAPALSSVRHTLYSARICSGTSPAVLCLPDTRRSLQRQLRGITAQHSRGAIPLAYALCSQRLCPLAHRWACALPCVICSACSRYAPTRGYSICSTRSLPCLRRVDAKMLLREPRARRRPLPDPDAQHLPSLPFFAPAASSPLSEGSMG